MTAVTPVTFNGNTDTRRKTETAAAGVGATWATASYASKKGVWATVGNTASKASRFTQKTADIMASTSKSTGWLKRLAATFRLKRAAYIEDFAKLAENVKNIKLVGAVMNNPIARKAGAAFGGVMAFFVLVPSIMKMVDFADQIASR